MGNRERGKDVFETLTDSALILDELNEQERFHHLIRPILESLGFKVDFERTLPGDGHLRPDFLITNLPINVIGEVKPPEGYERGKEQLRDYLINAEFDKRVGIITDGLRWEIYTAEKTDDSVVFTSFSEADLTPVLNEIREDGGGSFKELKSIQELRQFVSLFSKPQFRRLLDEVDLFSEDTNVREFVEQLDLQALELLYEEANEKIQKQINQRRFYQSIGFKLARTAIISISILVSIGAIIVNRQQVLSVSLIINLYTVLGGSLLIISVFVSTVSPILIGGITERSPQRVYGEYFEFAIPGSHTDGIETKRDILTKLLSQNCRIGRTYRESIKYLLGAITVALALQLVGLCLVIYGIIEML